jgi:hypothetical protein
LAAVLCDKVKATNPKCEISAVVRADAAEPVVDIVYGAWPYPCARTFVCLSA